MFTSVHTYPVLRGVYACHFHPTLTCGVTEIWHLRCQLYLPAGALSPLLYPSGDAKVRHLRCQLYPAAGMLGHLLYPHGNIKVWRLCINYTHSQGWRFYHLPSRNDKWSTRLQSQSGTQHRWGCHLLHSAGDSGYPLTFCHCRL